MNVARPAVFLDRDGTIIREVDYLRSPDQVRLLPGAADAIKGLNEAGFAVVMATNQSGIARGLLTEDDLARIHAVVLRRLARHGARVDAVYYCPHHPEATVAAYRKRCRCRKPCAGMLRRAARELDLDLARSYVIGDRARDLEPGHRLRCTTILLRTGYGAREEADWRRRWRPDFVADNLLAVAVLLLGRHLMSVAELELSRLTGDKCAQP
jgi:D-glycero-D-manno-heptose 1,7-bisphosphate phosphatase